MPVNFNDFMKQVGTLNKYQPGATTTSGRKELPTNGGRPPVKPNPAAPRPGSGVNKGGVSEQTYYSDALRSLQAKQNLENKKLDVSAGIERAKLDISRQQSAAAIKGANAAIKGANADRKQKEKNDTWAYTLANRELHTRNVQGARDYALGKGQLKLENRKVDSNERVSLAGINSNEKLGMAKVGNERYNIDTQKAIAFGEQSTKRYGIDKDYDLGIATNKSKERIATLQLGVQERSDKRNAMANVISNWGMS